jgi:two-component system osmolarity sensor histidine kinase EnvZ
MTTRKRSNLFILNGPSSLLGRTNLTLGFSSMLMVVVSTIALYVFVIDPIVERSADDEAALLVLSCQTWVELPPAARPYFELELAQNHDLIISEAIMDLPVLDRFLPYTALLQDKLRDRLDMDVRMLDGDDLVWVVVPMADYELQVGLSPDRRDIQLLYVAIVISGLGAAIVFLTSLLIVRRIARPLVKVANQAEQFRGIEDIEPLPETGPRELVSLARNFNTMASEISLLLANRTTLMAGISHDLRTPLTRMRLALALLPDNVDAKLITRFESNLETMDELIRDALHFAKGTGELAEEITVVEFVKGIVATYDQGITVSSDIASNASAVVAPNAFARVLTNLLSNGINHGGDVTVHISSGEISVSDNGPGIAKESRTEVFQPFFRLETSRSVTTGGSGLGLAIVQQLCQAHGWQIEIDDAATGGAKFTLIYAAAIG